MNGVPEQIVLAELIQKELDGGLTDQEFDVLQSMLKKDAAAVNYYVKTVFAISTFSATSITPAVGSIEEDQESLMDTLVLLAKDEETAPAIEVPKEQPPRELIQKVVYPPRQKRKISKFQIFTLITSAAAVLFVIAFPKIVSLKPASVEVATLVDQVDAKWAKSESGETPLAGFRLWSRGEPLWLQKGTVKIEFDYGAEVIIEGPAEFELESADKMILHSGRLYATVSRGATGFTVQSPYSTVIDLGTEFGVRVDFDGSTDVHMFKGKASLIPGAKGKKEESLELLAGQAKSVNTYGQVQNIALSEKNFLPPDQFEIMSKADKGSAYHRWLLYSNKLRQDPSLVAYYTFEKNEQRPGILENKASLTMGKLDGDLYNEIDGKLPSWAVGRWPQKTALNFDRSERQRVVVPSDPALHINGPITIAAWIRCDEPDEGGHIVSCRLPDRGIANYQLGFDAPDPDPDVARSYWDGNIQFGRMDGLKKRDRVHSDQIFHDSPRWRFIAATHDNKEVRFYADGKLIEIHPFELYQEQVIAGLVIGAANVSGDALRFSGEMDELMILRRVLTSKEIGEMYTAGRPE